MQKYLVGGAVRDKLLKYPVKERDWVVVGSTKEELLAQNFIQVGRDFPVFLHPQTREEYALARREKKLAPGYYGFDCDFSPDVSLEEDLKRRDLTINAMAMDDNGVIIDPWQGQKDLKAKVLRHVSDSFIEDPVRILRVARFAARYHHLGFKLADETKALIYQMVQEGEVNHLVPERIWQEFSKSLEEKDPVVFFQVLRATGAMAVLFPEIHALFGVPNPPKYHPEIDSGIHSLYALEAATKLSADPLIRFAALVHDLGKALTPMNEWPKHHRHEETGLPVIDKFCTRLRVPQEFKHLALVSCQLHLNIHRLFELRASTMVKTLEQADAFRRPQIFKNILKVCEADAQGTGQSVHYAQAEKWLEILRSCSNIKADECLQQGLQGAAIKNRLHEKRVECANLHRQTW